MSTVRVVSTGVIKPMKFVAVVLVAVAAFFASAGLAFAAGVEVQIASGAPKHALVIANTRYEGQHRLYNPTLDAGAIAVKLKGIGYSLFDNEVKANLPIDGLSDLVTRFFNSVPDGASTFIYYAGHGVALENANYLVPILPAGVTLRTEADIRNRTYALSNIIAEAEYQNPSGVNVILVDACRDAPVERSIYRSVNLLDGMTEMQTAPEGTFVGYSAEYGKKALDGNRGEHSPYAQEVLYGLDKQASLDIELFHKNVADRVFKRTGGKQFPIYEPRIRGKHCLIRCGEPNSALPLIEYGVVVVDPEPAHAEVCFLLDDRWNCDQAVRHHPMGAELQLRVSAKSYKTSQHKVVLTQPSQVVRIALRKNSLSTGKKIGIGIAAILAIGLLSGGGSDGPDSYPITLVPPGSE